MITPIVRVKQIERKKKIDFISENEQKTFEKHAIFFIRVIDKNPISEMKKKSRLMCHTCSSIEVIVVEQRNSKI